MKCSIKSIISPLPLEFIKVNIIRFLCKSLSIRNEVAKMVSSYLFISICNCVGALCTLMFQLQVVCVFLFINIHSVEKLINVITTFDFSLHQIYRLKSTKPLGLAHWWCCFYFCFVILEKWSQHDLLPFRIPHGTLFGTCIHWNCKNIWNWPSDIHTMSFISLD